MIKFFCFAQHEILYIPYFSQLGKFYTIAEVFSITDTSPCKRRHATYICNECDNLSIKIDWQLLCCRVLCFMGLPFGQNKSRSGAWEVGASHVRTQGCYRQHLSHFCDRNSLPYLTQFVNREDLYRGGALLACCCQSIQISAVGKCVIGWSYNFNTPHNAIAHNPEFSAFGSYFCSGS